MALPPQMAPQANVQKPAPVAPQQAAPAPQPQGQPSLMQPQATPEPAAPSPAPKKDAKGGAKDAKAMASVAQRVEQHLNSLPPQQQHYFSQFMTPEMALILGILLGDEAYQYFKQFADPNKQLTVVPKQNTAPQPAAGSGQQQAQAQPQPTPQSQASPPGRTIMGR